MNSFSPISPSQSLGMLLNQQMSSPGTFAYLDKRLGKELVDSIPTVFLPSDVGASDYPRPWKNAAELPADVVKGVFPITKRPFLAMRYMDIKVHSYILEVFSQRYSDERQPSVNVYELFTGSEGSIEFSLKNYSKNWASTLIGSGSSICKCNMTKATFEIVKNILHGNDLNSTEGRYLPLFKDRFVKSQS